MSTSRPAEQAEPAAPRGPRSAATFIGQWQIWLLGIPAVGTAGFLIGAGWSWHIPGTGITMPFGLFDGAARTEIAWLAGALPTLLACLVVGHGLVYRKRHPWPVLHLAASIEAVGILITITVAFGWPLWWAIAHFALSATFALSWNMHYVGVLRGDAREKGGAGDDDLRQAVGIAKSRPQLDKVTTTEFATTIPFRLEGGETEKTLAEALPRLEAVTNSLTGRGRVEPSGRAGEVSLTVMHRDPFTDWLRWPGLSRPGGSFQDGIRTAYYDTGREQAYYLPADPPNARPRSAILRAGTTGAGKSGDFDIELAETLSRVDVHAIRIDTAKFMQNTAWALPHLTLGADSLPLARVLEQGIQEMAEYRIKVMGAHGHRDWTPATFRELGFAAWLLQYDEADTVLASIAEWLATKSLSAGIFMSVTIPSADHKSMPMVIRRSLGNRKCFGTGDDVAAGMVLTDSTRKNGPDPYEWGAKFPGAHLLDRAPGVDPRLFVVSSRTYRAEHDELAAAVGAVRGRRFAAPPVTPGEIGALGEAWEMCQPARLGQAVAAPPQPSAPQRETIQIRADVREQPVKEGDMQVQDVFKVPEYEPKIDENDRETYNRIDPRKPIERGDAPNIQFDDDVPVPPDDATAGREFDRVITEMWREGKREFRNRDALERCRMWDSVMMTRHLADLDAGKAIQPPGLVVSRRATGRWLIRQA
jgi:hypothetical protein